MFQLFKRTKKVRRNQQNACFYRTSKGGIRHPTRFFAVMKDKSEVLG